jgi:hypothetical protein
MSRAWHRATGSFRGTRDFEGGKFQGFPPTFNAGGEGVGRPTDPIKQGARFTAGGEASGKGFEQDAFGVAVQDSLRAACVSDAGHGAVNQGPEGFHQVVGQAEGVVPVVMVNTQGGMQASAAKATSGNGPQYGVAVVEAGIQSLGFWVAAEFQPVE